MCDTSSIPPPSECHVFFEWPLKWFNKLFYIYHSFLRNFCDFNTSKFRHCPVAIRQTHRPNICISTKIIMRYSIIKSKNHLKSQKSDFMTIKWSFIHEYYYYILRSKKWQSKNCLLVIFSKTSIAGGFFIFSLYFPYFHQHFVKNAKMMYINFEILNVVNF